MAEKIEFDVLINGKPAIDELGKVKQKQDEVGGNNKKVTNDMGQDWIALGAKVYATVQSLQFVYEATGKQIQAEQALKTALNNSQSVQDKSIKNWQDYASALQSVTTFGDEAIIPLIAMGAQMGMTDETIRATIEAATDLSAATGTDLNQAFKNLGKTLTGQAEEEIVSMATGLKGLTSDQLKAGEGITLVAQQYKGAASEMAATSFGETKQNLNALGDSLEKLGSFILGLAQDSGALWLFGKAVDGISIGLLSMSGAATEAQIAVKKLFGEDVSELLKKAHDYELQIKQLQRKMLGTVPEEEAWKWNRKKEPTENKVGGLVGFTDSSAAASAKAKADADAKAAAATSKANKEKITAFMDELAKSIADNSSPEDAIALKYQLLEKKLTELSLLPEMSQKQKDSAKSKLTDSKYAEEQKQKNERAKAADELDEKYIQLTKNEYDRTSQLSTHKMESNIRNLLMLKSIDEKGAEHYDRAIEYEKTLNSETQARITWAKEHAGDMFDLELAMKYAEEMDNSLDNEMLKLKTKAELQYEMNMANLEELRTAKTITEEQYERMKKFYEESKENSVASTWARGIMDMEDKTKGFQNVAMNAFGGMEDAILKATKTGKLQFKDMANAILDDLLKMAIRMTITANIARSIGMGAGWGVPMAQGGVFDGGGQARNAQGNVFSSPTNFRFAGGSGLLGEKGSEAIMPLKRTTSGDLGVQVAGGSSAPTKVQIINESGNKMEVTSSNISQDNDGYILSVVINGIAKNKMGIRTLMGGK